MGQRYIPNDGPLQSLSRSPKLLLVEALTELIRTYPPVDKYPEAKQKGIFSGYTSLVYLLLRVSTLYPDIQVDGHDISSWMEEYMKPLPGDIRFKSGSGGLHSEKLSVDAIRASISGSKPDLDLFLKHVHEYIGPYTGEDPYPAELFYGRAGVLYILRMVKQHVPNYAPVIEPYIDKISEKIMNEAEKGHWKFANKRFLGPCHGDIGIITQLVMSKPSIAPRLEDRLVDLLDLQDPEGNWPASGTESKTHSDLVQFCHGAAGYIICLKVLRPYFPNLKERIENAISKGEALVWERGLLRKEPSICHGILGNALYAV